MKSVLVHAVLALFGLGFAYQTWARKPDAEEAPGAVVLAECREAEIQKLRFENKEHIITVEPQRQKDETAFWVTTQVKRKGDPAEKKLPDGGVIDDRPMTPALKEELRPRTFLANAAFKDYLKRLTPLRAVQGLGTLAKDKLKDFGFDEVDTRLSVQCAGKQLQFEAGGKTYGGGQRYVRDPKTKIAYLLSDEIVTDLQQASTKFMQSELHMFTVPDVEEATVSVRGTKKQVLQRDRKFPDRAKWVEASAPDKRNELYGNWFSRVFRLKAREYLARGAEPGTELEEPSGELTPVVQIDYKLDGKPNGKLELVRVDQDDKPRYYARTETTRGWVLVYDSTAKDVDQDAAMVVGLEEAPASKTEPKSAAAANSPHGAGSPHGAAAADRADKATDKPAPDSKGGKAAADGKGGKPAAGAKPGAAKPAGATTKH